MASAIPAARRLNSDLTHLWCTDAPVRSKYFFRDEQQGAGACNFESLFEEISFFRKFHYAGQGIRILSEHKNLSHYSEIRINDEVHFLGGPINDEHFDGVAAVAVLTSIALPINDMEKAEIYNKYFKPRREFIEKLEQFHDILKGRWLGVHLRNGVRTAFGFEEWTQEEMRNLVLHIAQERNFDRIVVFSDCARSRSEFLNRIGRKVNAYWVDWQSYSYIEAMFLDFLAMARASFIVSSGMTSFSKEASLFGGAIPFLELPVCRQN